MPLISVLADALPGSRLIGDAHADISRPVALDTIEAGQGAGALAWLKPDREERWPAGQPVGLLICTQESLATLQTNNAAPANVLLTPEPRRAFAHLLDAFFAPPPRTGIEPTAQIHARATIGAGCYIGHFVVVEDGCVIGPDTQIFHHTVLMAGTQVGARVVIGSHCSIGLPGFGYEPDKAGVQQPIPHLGHVVIADGARIHSNTCIDRAVLGQTLVDKDARVDNLVHLAHGSHIGERAMVVANAMIAGSSKIGADAWIAPSVNVLNQITVGAGASTGMAANVVKNVPDGQTVVGSPAEPIDTFKAWLKVRKGLLASG